MLERIRKRSFLRFTNLLTLRMIRNEENPFGVTFSPPFHKFHHTFIHVSEPELWCVNLVHLAYS